MKNIGLSLALIIFSTGMIAGAWIEDRYPMNPVSEEQTCVVLPAPQTAHGTVDEENRIAGLQAKIAIQEYQIATLTARIDAALDNLEAP